MGRVHERQAVRIIAGMQRRLVHQTANREVRHQHAIEFLPYQFRRLAAQHDLCPAQMCLQFIKRGLDFPPFVVQKRQFSGGSLLRIEDRSYQPVYGSASLTFSRR